MKLREEVRWLGENYTSEPAAVLRADADCGVELSLSQHAERCGAARAAGGVGAERSRGGGYRRLHILLTGSGERVNHKRVFRVYREAGLAVRRKARKRLVREGSPQPVLTAANQEWAVDFAHDALANGRAIRVLTVEDEYTRESLALPVDTSFASRRVTRELESILARREKPLAIRCDNGPEFTSRHFLAWCIEEGRSRWCTFSRESRSRTGTWKVSTASCGMNA